jgi:hypothetical protein
MSNRWRLLAATSVVLALAATLDPARAAAQQDVVVAPGTINSATTMALVGDGRIFVAEQSGALRVIKNGALLPTPFATVSVTSTDERGLLGIAIDPSFAVNRYVYVYYTAASPVVNRVSRFTASATNPDVAEPGSETVILNKHPVAVRLPQRRRAPVRARRQALLRRRREPHEQQRPEHEHAHRQAAPDQRRRHDPDRQPVLRDDEREQPRDLGARPAQPVHVRHPAGDRPDLRQ